jgi:four helix bundle protein
MGATGAGSIRDYRDLLVWQRAVDLVVLTYRLAESLPRFERYGLTSQLQRAAVSVAANIAEGHGRDHLGDYLHHLSMSNGSLMELETLVRIIERLNFGSHDERAEVLSVSGDVGRMLAGLVRALKRRRASA